MTLVWRRLDDALDRLAAQGRTVTIWLRDDDAVAPTPALARLITVCERVQLPALLAVIPAGATQALADYVGHHPILTPTQHGYAHANHAPADARARELGGTRGITTVLDDLARGRDRLQTLFGPYLTTILVPPWNRIDDDVVPHLPACGYSALSTFGPSSGCIDLPRLNADLDIIDWRNGRRGRPAEQLVPRLIELIASKSEMESPIGLLTHHLVHDDTAWHFLEHALARLVRHAGVRFARASDLVMATDCDPDRPSR